MGLFIFKITIADNFKAKKENKRIASVGSVYTLTK